MPSLIYEEHEIQLSTTVRRKRASMECIFIPDVENVFLGSRRSVLHGPKVLPQTLGIRVGLGGGGGGGDGDGRARPNGYGQRHPAWAPF